MATQTLITPEDTHSGLVVSRRDLPWMTKNSAAFENDNPSVEEAMRAGGIDFTVDARKVYTTNARGHRLTVPGYQALVRSDTEATLGIVGTRFKAVQNGPALAIGDEVVRLGGRVEAAVSLRGGKLCALMLELPEFASFKVPGDDSGYGTHIWISNSFDGNSSIIGAINVLRLRCLNAVSPFIRGASRVFKIRHTSQAEARLHEAERLLIGAETYMRAYEREAAKLAGLTLAEAQAKDIVESLWPVREDLTAAQRENTIAAGILQNWHGTDTLDESLRRTGWGLVQATAEYFEHVVDFKPRTYDASDVRAYSTLYGTAAHGVDRVMAELRRAA
jgi:phage/plasmid-like protein (TIGR03299 family)